MFKASRVSNIQGGSLCMTDARSGITKWGECLALKLHLFHKLIVISSEKLISSNLGLFSHVNPFCFLYHVVRWLSAKFWRDLYRVDKSTKLCMVVA